MVLATHFVLKLLCHLFGLFGAFDTHHMSRLTLAPLSIFASPGFFASSKSEPHGSDGIDADTEQEPHGRDGVDADTEQATCDKTKDPCLQLCMLFHIRHNRFESIVQPRAFLSSLETLMILVCNPAFKNCSVAALLTILCAPTSSLPVWFLDFATHLQHSLDAQSN